MHYIEYLIMQTCVFMAAIVELMHNYLSNYAAPSSNGNQAKYIFNFLAGGMEKNGVESDFEYVL